MGGAPITLAEVDDKALEQPAANFGSVKLSQALYEARRAALDEIVANKLIDAAAKAQGIDRAALIEKEITVEDSAGHRRRDRQLVSGEPGRACRARRSSRCGSRSART